MQPLRTVDVQLQVNGQGHALRLTSAATLLHVLRNDLGLNSPKFGCGLGQCGACTVLIDGTPARACVIPAQEIQHRDITTSEGLGQASAPHPVQQAFIDEQAAQCGYCVPGILMSAQALIQHNPKPSEAEICAALDANLCRCGTHARFVRAVLRATGQLPEATPHA
jgi:nicotinate dehydrogenase subunit A